MQTVKNKTNMQQDYQCKFCKCKFHKESTLASHQCVKKRRYMEMDSSGPRFGFRAFQRFYELTSANKKIKSIEDFIDSPFYIDFAKFGNHLANLKPLYMDQFIDFVIRNGVKLKDWNKDFVYDTYVKQLVLKEPAVSATERTINEVVEWCNKNNTDFEKFFITITSNEAAYMIKTGRLSPWVLYLSLTGESLISRFNEDHAKMIGDIIDPGLWMKQFKKNDEDVSYIRNLLEQAGL